MAEHEVGDVVTLFAVFRDLDGAQADPTTLTLALEDPDGNDSSVSPEAAETGDLARAELATGETLSGTTGVYLANIPVDRHGTWRYRWLGTGAVAKGKQGAFLVERLRVGEVEGS
jgi:hypothetical protein